MGFVVGFVFVTRHQYFFMVMSVFLMKKGKVVLMKINHVEETFK